MTEIAPGAATRSHRSAEAPTVGRTLDYAFAAGTIFVASYALALQESLQSLAWLLLYALALGLFVLNYASFLEGLGRSRLILLWPAIALLSVIWSVAPEQTLRFALQLLMTVLISIYIGSRFSLRELSWIVFLVLAATALASLIAIALKLGFAVDHNGLARGIFPHKNALGGRMVFLLAVSMVILIATRYRITAAVTAAVMALIALALIGLSSSGTAIVMAAAVLGVTPLFLLSREGGTAILLTGLAILAAASLLFWAVASFGLDPVGLLLAALGKEETLTGRSVLWEFARGMIAERPFLGHGYRAIWIADPASTGSFMQAVMRQEIQSFHNSFLDITSQLGLVGLCGTLLTLAACALLALRSLTGPGNFMRSFPSYIVLLILVYSFSEYAIFRHHDFIQLLLGAVYASLAQMSRAQSGERFRSPNSR